MDTKKIFSPEHLRSMQTKMHGLAFGMTLGLGSMYIGQGCPTVGQ